MVPSELSPEILAKANAREAEMIAGKGRILDVDGLIALRQRSATNDKIREFFSNLPYNQPQNDPRQHKLT